MKRTHKRRLALLLVAVALVGGVLFLRSQVGWAEACSLARRSLPAVLGMEVGIGRCEIDPTRQTVRLYGVYAQRPSETEPLFFAEMAEVRLGAFQPLFGSLKLDSVRLIHPRLSIDLATASAPTGRAAPRRRCPLQALERVQVAELSIKGAELRIRLPQGRRVELSGLDLGWKMRRGVAELELDARAGSWAPGEGKPELALNRLWLEGKLDPEELSVEIDRSELAVEDATLAVTGKIEQLCDPSLLLEGQLFLPVRSIARLAGIGEKVGGHLWAGVSASGAPADLRISADLVGTGMFVGPFHPGDLTGRVSLAGGELSVTELTLGAGSGTVRVSGALGSAGQWPLKLKLDAENAELGRILEKAGLPGPWVNAKTSGRVSLQGHLLPSFALAGEADLRTAAFSVFSHPFDAAGASAPVFAFEQGRLSAAVKVAADRVELHEFQISSGKSHYSGDAALSFDPARGLSIRSRADAIDLSDYGRVGPVSLSGAGTALFEVVGPYRAVRVSGSLAVRELELADFSLGVVQSKASFGEGVLRFPSVTGQKGKTQYFGSTELDLGTGPGRLRVDVAIPDGRVADLVDAVARLNPGIALFQGALSGAASGTLRLNSPLGKWNGALSLELRQLDYQGRDLGEGTARLAFRHGETMDLEKLEVRGPLGKFTASGSYDFSGPLDYQFRGEGLSLSQLVGPERAQSLGIQGTVTLAGKVQGDSTVPVLRAYASCPSISFAERNLGEMLLEAQLQGRELQVWGRPFDDARAQIKIRLQDALPFEASLSLALPEIRPLLPGAAASRGLSGSLSGSLTARGMIKDRSTLKAAASFDRVTLSRGDFSATNAGPISLQYGAGKLSIESLAFRGPNTQFSVSGWMGSQGLDVKVLGGADVRLLESFVPAVERTGGRLELSASAKGTWENPSLFGTAKIRNARLSLRDQPISVRQLSGDVEFSEAHVLVRDTHGILNDGRISLQSDVRLEHFAVKEVELGAQLDEVAFRPTEDLPLTTSGELHLYGRPEALVLAGDLDVLKLRYEKPLAVEALLKNLATSRGGGARAGERREWLRLDLRVHLGDVRVENNLANGRLVGDLKLTGTNVHPGLLGTVEAGPGSQAFFRGNRFAVTHGLVEFKNKSDLDAEFDLHAETQVREYLVRLHAFGRAQEPKVIFSSEPELPESDILSLLTLGVTSKDRSTTAQASAGLAAEALFSASGLDRQVQRFLPKNPVLRDLSFHISTAYNDATGLVEPAAQLESKFLTEQLKLDLARPVSGRGTRAQAEYRFENGLSAQAQWDNEQSDSSFGNLGMDLKLRWEVE